MTDRHTTRSLRDWLALLRTELIDLAARGIVAAFDPGARQVEPIRCPDCAARARAAGHVLVPAQNAQPATETTPAAQPAPQAARQPLVGIVSATCPDCGNVEIPDSTTIDGAFYQNAPELNWYAFTCPNCQQRHRKRAGDAVVAALTKVRTSIIVTTVPSEALEQHPTGVLRRDDVLDAILELDQTDDLAALAADTRKQPRQIDLTRPDGDR